MPWFLSLLFFAANSCALEDTYKPGNYTKDQEGALMFVSDYDRTAENIYFQSISAGWDYETNLTQYNQQRKISASLVQLEFTEIWAKKAKELFDGISKKFNDTELTKMLSIIRLLGPANLDPQKREKYNSILTELGDIYSTAKVCPPNQENITKCWSLDLDLAQLLAKSKSYPKLLHAWEGWHDAAGVPQRDNDIELVELSNEASRLDGFKDTGDYWNSRYEPSMFEEDLEYIYQQLKPLYLNLHAYVRRKLHQRYGARYINLKGPIPAHLLGNMWGHEWSNIYKTMVPFPDKDNVDVTEAMVQQNWNVTRMFRVAEDFFRSLSLSTMPEEFWDESMLERPKDGREVMCHPGAWDFLNRRDFRIKQCATVTMEQLLTMHHQMGHIQYYLQYKGQPVLFRKGANPAFHEAIGGLITLSVSTAKHLKKIGLLQAIAGGYEADINYLLKMALEKIAYLPFAYLMDQWRWGEFSGCVSPLQYNYEWWYLRTKYQGICPPVSRNETHFDAGAIDPILRHKPYVRYFVSFILQFQFHKALCKASNHTGSLHSCDIDGSTVAGEKLRQAMRAGFSRSWKEILKEMTGDGKMDASAVLEYFEPLAQWLSEQNKLNNDVLGWPDFDWRPQVPDGYPNGIEKNTDESEAEDLIQKHNMTAGEVVNDYMEAMWAYNINITEHNKQVTMDQWLMISNHTMEFGLRARQFDSTGFHSEATKRILRKLSDLGSAILPKGELIEYNNLLTDMELTYSVAKVCGANGTCHPLQPDLVNAMASSLNYKELLFTWEGWRDVTGKKIRKTFKRFVELSNKAARLNGHADTGAYWRSFYDTETFEADIEKIYHQLQPLYLNLHAYARRGLYQKYGDKYINLKGPIPAHLLGNMWAQTWNNIYDLLAPYPNATYIDVTQAMIAQGWTPNKMFEESDNFFSSLGLIRMPQEFWDKSMLVKPEGREVMCQASAWDFYNRKDYRIKQCTEVNMEHLITAHHEMGHIQYFLQYKDQPVAFREGANPGFQEAIGDLMALSVSTPKHLHSIGLLSEVGDSIETDINYLLRKALYHIAFIPFAYLMDKWRWKVFDRQINEKDYNQQWWNLRLNYQGLCSPVPRSEEDFDPGSKYHIVTNVPYIRYFVSFIIQFQFHERLCEAANQTGSLFKCDIYHSKEAGKLIAAVLKLGSSKPWPEAMRLMMGKPDMSAESLLKYFKPLTDWLIETNTKNGETLGWPEYDWTPDLGSENLPIPTPTPSEVYPDMNVVFLGITLNPQQAKAGQWILLSLSIALILLILFMVVKFLSNKRSSKTLTYEVELK